MKIEKEKYVNIDYILKNDRGEIIDSTEGGDSMSYIHGIGALIIGLENELEGKTSGSEVSVIIPPESAYGLRNEDLIEEVPLSDLQGIDLKVGMQLQAQTPHGVQIFTISQINSDHAVMDGNHPLAGENLHFHVKINEVRDATAEELEGTKHSCCGGHDHEHEHEHHDHSGGCQSGACSC
ncbi:MAG: peptidylprolyl isomerase [Spirochaetia bacterium]|nr:peptidylprolyl isomerase [Spirochaetia bacterium]